MPPKPSTSDRLYKPVVTSSLGALGVTHRTFVAPAYPEMARFAAEFLRSALAGSGRRSGEPRPRSR